MTDWRLPALLADAIIQRHGALRRPIVVGVCGPQGCGKSTACADTAKQISDRGLRVVTLSIDDFYLSQAKRNALARMVHPLFVTRGPPGTHDVQLAETVVEALLAGDPVRLPAFDKSTDDCVPIAAWSTLEGKTDIVILEGWCVGARPQPRTDLAKPINRLEQEEDADGLWRKHANHALEAYQPLFGHLDLLVAIQPPDFAIVPRWRQEQESALIRTLAPDAQSRCMTPSEIQRFVEHYERWTRHMMEEMPGRADLRIDLDNDRRVVAISKSPVQRMTVGA